MDSNPKSGGENTQAQTGEASLELAETLIWSLLDNEIEPTGVKQLESLLQEDEQVRQLYVNCVQMHTDLQEHFGESKAPQTFDTLPKSPVLGSLGELQPGTEPWSPVPE